MNVETQDKRIDIILITGFLGAGKTTLVNRLLAGAIGEGAGLLVNDFGEVVVDGKLIENTDGLEIFEVAGGSIFCTCKTDNFAAGLRTFAKLKPSRLIIEASGISDPSGLEKILTEYRLAADFTLARIVCLADAVRTPRMMNNLMPLKMQLAAADLVLINKCDLVEDSELSTFETEIRKLNPKVEIHRTIRADMDMALLSGTADSTHRGSIESCNTPGNRPASFQIKPSGIPRDSLDAFLHDQLTSTWRIKGWVKADNSWWYISDNAGSIEWTESELPPGMTPGLTIITPADKYLAVDEAWKKFNTGK